MQLLFLHWGLHGWGVFALAAMAMAYFAYRHNLPLALRSALYPLIGKRINGPIGYTVDALGIVATVFGIGADMGFGVLHLKAGLAHLFNIPHSNLVQIMLVVAMMGHRRAHHRHRSMIPGWNTRMFEQVRQPWHYGACLPNTVATSQ